MRKRRTIRFGAVLFLAGLLAGCGGEREAQTIGPPDKTVRQVTQWPEGFAPSGGGYRFVDAPANAGEASSEAEGRQEYFQTLRR